MQAISSESNRVMIFFKATLVCETGSSTEDIACYRHAITHTRKKSLYPIEGDVQEIGKGGGHRYEIGKEGGLELGQVLGISCHINRQFVLPFAVL